MPGRAIASPAADIGPSAEPAEAVGPPCRAAKRRATRTRQAPGDVVLGRLAAGDDQGRLLRRVGLRHGGCPPDEEAADDAWERRSQSELVTHPACAGPVTAGPTWPVNACV